MEVRWEVLLIIIGGTIVTFLPRVVPLVVLSKINLPEWAMRWLHYIPVAILASLLAQELLPLGEQASWQPSRLIAAAVSVTVAWLTKSLVFTVAAGVMVIFLFNLFI